MQPKLIDQSMVQKTDLYQYTPAQFAGANTSGANPIGDRVLVKPDRPAAKWGGAVHVPDEVIERMAYAAETGVIVAMGEDAFRWNSDRTRPFEGEKPKVGQRVFFDRYAGGMVRGNDGERYRVMDDKCIGALLQE
jgi:chaperonin GroES